ncbi:MAG TPA: NAD(P)-dependent oxidoreductase [Alphaproteobacteria bacterium]
MAEAVGFVGLGNMGAPIARRLIDAGHAVRVYNRTAAKAAPLVEAGAKRAEAPGGVAAKGGVVLSIVSDDAALEEIALGPDGVLAALGPGGVHVSMSTVAVATARRMEALHAEAGATYLCAPVFGRPAAAAAGKLWVALSGQKAAKVRVAPLLGAFSQGVRDFGDAPGAANVVKLSGNFLIGAAIEAISEACALAEKNGVDRAAFVELLSGSLFDCPVYRIYGEGIAKRQYEPPGFRLSLGLKDVNLVLAAAAAAEVPMPLASLVHDRLLASVAKGRSHLDWMAMDLSVSEDAGTK